MRMSASGPDWRATGGVRIIGVFAVSKGRDTICTTESDEANIVCRHFVRVVPRKKC